MKGLDENTRTADIGTVAYITDYFLSACYQPRRSLQCGVASRSDPLHLYVSVITLQSLEPHWSLAVRTVIGISPPIAHDLLVPSQGCAGG